MLHCSCQCYLSYLFSFSRSKVNPPVSFVEYFFLYYFEKENMSSFFRLREKIFLPGVEVGLRPSHPHHHLHELGRQAPHLGLQPLPETGEHDTAARQHDVPAVRNKLFIHDTGLCGCFSVKRYHELQPVLWSRTFLLEPEPVKKLRLRAVAV